MKKGVFGLARKHIFCNVRKEAERIVECPDNNHRIGLLRRYFHESY